MSWLSKWQRKRREKARFRKASRSEVFQYIYDTNKWGAPNSRSGKGSELERTQAIREALPSLLERLQIESILDIPCGDLNWLSTLDLSGYRYTGADIVPALIEQNQARYPEHTFIVADICTDPLPGADLVMMRDLLVHLSFADIERAERNMATMDARYVACTTFPGLARNVDKLTGNHRHLNMCIAPFDWPQPLELIDDEVEGGDDPARKCLGVWDFAALRAHVEQRLGHAA